MTRKSWTADRACCAVPPLLGRPATQSRSADSFASPVLEVMHGAVEMKTTGSVPEDFFPSGVERHSSAVDRIEISLYRRGADFASRQLASLRSLHRPRLQQYLLYMFVALVLLLSWAARLVKG